MIIAIGESLVAVGLGARDERLHGDVIIGALLGLLVAMSFWLAYFDFFTIRGRQLLDERSGEERIAIARDIYTFLHLPMVAGIVLFAFAVKSALKHLGDELGTIEALALCGGSALYLFAYVALRFRVARSVRGGRLVAAIVLCAADPCRHGWCPSLVRARPGRGRLGCAPRVRAHLVARGTRTAAGTATPSGRPETAAARGVRTRLAGYNRSSCARL